MSNYEDDEDDFELDSNDAFSQLRKANKQKDKQLKEIQSELAELRKEKRDRTIKETLTSRGVNPKIAAFIPQDIDLTEESLSNWLNEYGDVFGVESQSSNQASSNLPEGFKENYMKAQSTIDSGLTADRERLIQAQMEEAAAKGPDALKQLFADLGKQGY
jgi:hypothetical protein